MKKLLLVLFVSAIFMGNIYSQSFIGKNKTQAKKELLTGGGRVSDIKSCGYDGYIHRGSRNMYGVLFNEKGICFLEMLFEFNESFANVALQVMCRSDNNHVYRIIPSISKRHEFIEGKTTIELVVEPNAWLFYIFQPKFKQDVLNYFEKKYHDEYLNIEKREQKEEQEKLKKQEVMNILSMVDKIEIEKEVYDYNKNKLLKASEDWDVLKEPRNEKFNVNTEVLIYADSLNSKVVKINDDIIDNELLNLYKKSSSYCIIDDINYHKYQNAIFYTEKINETITLEKGMYGLKKQKDKFKYYKTTPSKIQKWCQNNITQNGFHAVEYINYNGQYIIQLITVSKDMKKELQGGKNKKIWYTLGGILVLGVGLGVM